MYTWGGKTGGVYASAGLEHTYTITSTDATKYSMYLVSIVSLAMTDYSHATGYFTNQKPADSVLLSSTSLSSGFVGISPAGNSSNSSAAGVIYLLPKRASGDTITFKLNGLYRITYYGISSS